MNSQEERVAAQLEQIVLNRLQGDNLTLPTMPQIALKCMELLRKPDFSLQKAATLVETDPILALRIIKVANSAAMAGREPARNIQAAVTRLGGNQLRSALVEFSARSVFESRNRRIVEATKGLWEHSVAVAMMSRDLSVLCAVGDPEDAYLAGLLHDIGKPVLATLLLEAENMVAQRSAKGWIEPNVWLAVLQKTHRKVGTALAKKWQLPASVTRAVEDCGDFDAQDRLSTANIVRFANAVVKQQGIYVGEVNADDNDALIMVGRSLLSVDDEKLTRLIADLTKRVKEAS